MEGVVTDDATWSGNASAAKRTLETLHRTETKAIRSGWAAHRTTLAGIVESNLYMMCMGCVIGVHAILIIQETDLRASGSQVDAWRGAVSYMFFLLYLVDLTIRLYVHRQKFFQDSWNQLDFSVLTIDIICMALTPVIGEMPSMAVLRVFRLSRLLRFIRLLRMFRELDIMLMGFLSAMRAMFWAACMLMVLLTFFSIVAVEVLNPIVTRLAEQGEWKDCERCRRAFHTVMGSNLTFMQQILAGDSWGLVSIPIIEEEPLAALFLVAVLVVIEFGMLNLIVTVIVDVANSAREADELRKLEERAREFEVMKTSLLKLCEELDEDGSGELSMEELLHGLDHNPRFAQLMVALDIGRDDMPLVFKLLDEDGSGSVVYKEFVEQLHKIKSQDTHTTLMFIKGYLNEVRSKVSEQMDFLQGEVVPTNIDMASSIHKILFGDPLTSPTAMTVLPEVESAKGGLNSARVGDGVLPAQALNAVACGEASRADEAGSSIVQSCQCPSVQPVLCAVPMSGAAAGQDTDEAAVAATPCGAEGGPRRKDESFLGLIQLEEKLRDTMLRLEERIAGELSQLSSKMAGKIDQQLALLQDWGQLAQPAAPSTQDVEPGCADAGGGGAEPSGSDWNASLWEPSQQEMRSGAEENSSLLLGFLGTAGRRRDDANAGCVASTL